VLKVVAGLLNKHFSSEHIVARLGGEEFSVFFDDMSLNDAAKRLEAFRIELEQTAITSGKRNIKCAMSIGVTHATFEQLDQLLIYADELLYQAKQNGRNQLIAR